MSAEVVVYILLLAGWMLMLLSANTWEKGYRMMSGHNAKFVHYVPNVLAGDAVIDTRRANTRGRAAILFSLSSALIIAGAITWTVTR